MTNYDAIIIGSGQAGTPLATALSAKGWRVALVEKVHVGGTCVNDGCTPTKAMVASAKNAYQARRASEYGVQAGPVKIDMPALVQRKNRIVAQSRDGLSGRFDKAENLRLMKGRARFTGPKEVKVFLNDNSTEDCKAEYIFINTGERPAVPPLKGLDEVPYLTSTTILDIDFVPPHLLIIGGSYVALEFGQMFRRFGSEVTILERSDHFLPREDRDVAEEIKKIFEEDGISVLTGARVNKVAREGDDTINVSAEINGAQRQITGTHLLVAAGRTPNTDDLNLSSTGVDLNERGYIMVNDRLETSVSGIYALGDVKGGPAFTHISYNDYLVVLNNLVNKGEETIRERPVPYCIFIDPELGRIGLTEEEARKKGLNFRVAKMPMTYVARAIETGETRGFMKAIVDNDTKKILGAAILGAGGGELMSLLQIAMLGGITSEQLRDNIFSHPTYSESFNNLFNQLAGQ